MGVSEHMENFAKEDIPSVQSIKKKFDASRRDYDASITKVLQLQKEKKPNPLKIQQAEQERDKMKQIYINKGDEAYSSLLDINERAQFEVLERLLKYCEAYYQFFYGGYNFFRGFHNSDMVKYRNWIAEEKEKYEQRKVKRQKREWAPDIISDETLIKTRTFGIPYEDLIERDKPPNDIPVFIAKAIDQIKKRGLEVVGIFRISPPKSLLDELKNKIDRGIEINWDEIDDIHVCSGILKLFMRELTDPLMTFELYPKFLKTSTMDNESTKIKYLKEVLKELPKYNYTLLKEILHLFYLIEQKKEINKMTCINLAVVLCPSILYPEEPNPLTMVDDIEKCNRVLEIMISNFSELFNHPSSEKPKKPSSTKVRKAKSSKSTKVDKPSDSKPEEKSSNQNQNTSSDKDQDTSKVSPNTEVKTGESVNTETPPGSGKTINPSKEKSDTNKDKINDSSSSSTNVEETPTTNQETSPPPKPAQPRILIEDIPISLKEIETLLINHELSDEHYKIVGDLSHELCNFLKIVLSPDMGNNLQAVNEALKNVARATKDNITSIKTLASSIPVELARRLVDVGKELQRQLLLIANAFRDYNENNSDEEYKKLIEVIKDFSLVAYMTFIRIKETTLVDELSGTSKDIIECSKRFITALNNFENDKTSLALATNILMNTSFKFGALLRSKVLDSEKQDVILKLTKCIETAELSVKKIYEAVRPILSGQMELSSVINDIKNVVDSLISNAVIASDCLPSLFAQNNPMITNITLFKPVLEQMEADIISLQSKNSDVITPFLNAFKDINNSIKTLQNILTNDFKSRKIEWLSLAFEISNKVNSICNMVNDLKESISDQSLKVSFEKYSSSVYNISLILKTACITTLFDFKLDGIQENIRYMSALKDFVFISFPFTTILNSVANMN